jgi:acyl-coenzyme A synthetase/AMP-(fatty) acid ligase
MAADVAGLIESGAVNAAMFLVGDLQRLVQDARPPPRGHILRIEAVGATVSKLLRRQVSERWHATLVNSYSSVEMGWVAMIDEDGVGTLCPGAEVRIVDEFGRDKPIGESGLIRARTETMVHGYLDNTELTAADFADGWFRTSDVGVMPAPGRLIVLGRADDALNVGGVKVMPEPIEARIKAIDGVTDAVLVSVDGPRQAPILLVAIEIASGTPARELSARIGPIMAPYLRTFELLALRALPRTDSGKVRRQEVAEIYARALAQSRTV